jgi:mRNA-degrading endonuclease RelE of RelBE toxin-antitoxin system
MITSEVLKELMLLKKSDREKFLSRIEEMAFDSMDILLNYKKFKEYPANI